MQQTEATEWLIGTGEVAERIRRRDWTDSGLGSRDGWPDTLRTLVNLLLASPEPMCLAWSDEARLFYNDAYGALAERHGARLGEPAPAATVDLSTVTQVFRTGEVAVRRQNPWMVERDGRVERACFDVWYAPVRDRVGAVNGVLCTVRDVPGRRDCRDARGDDAEQYRLMFANSPVPMALSRLPDRTVIHANQAFLRMLELREEDVVGRRGAEIAITPDETYERFHKEFARRGAVHDLRCELRTGKGEPLTALIDVVPVGPPGSPLVMTTIRDWSAQRRLEEVSALYETSLRRLEDLTHMELLVRVSERLLQDVASNELLEEILAAAVAMTGADFGHVRVLDPRSGHLKIAVQRGFAPWWVEFWNQPPRLGACAAALSRRARVVVDDVEASPFFATDELQDVMRRAHVRSVQSTPLVSRAGVLLGVISTHATRPGRVSARALTFLDLLARQTADFIEHRNTLGALRRSEAKARSMVEHSADAVVCIDRERRITDWNHAAETMFGYRRDEILRQDLSVLLPARSHGAHRAHVAQFIAGPVTSRTMDHAAAWGVRRSGEEFPIDATISVFRFDDEELITASVRDITEQRRAEAEQRLLAEVGGALLRFDRADVIQSVLEILTRTLAQHAAFALVHNGGGLSPVAFASRAPDGQGPARALVELGRGPRRAHPAVLAVRRKKPVVVDLREDWLARVTGNPGLVEALRGQGSVCVAVAPLMVRDECIAVLGLSAFRHLDARDMELVQEVARRCTLSLQNARMHEREKRAIRARDEVLGVVAHDLRNPLNAIVLQAQRLQKKHGDDGGSADSPVQAIRRSAQRMNHMIEDLLDVTRFEAGELQLRLERVATTELVHDALDAQRALVAARGLTVRAEVADNLPPVWADRQRILQVFENLIGNAAKFTSVGEICVRASALDDEVQFQVSDTGRGIDREQLPHLFDRFWQAQKGSRGGAGLGLGIAKAIVEAHDGRIRVHSEPGRGTTIAFTLPTRARSETALEPVSAPTSSPA